MKDKKINFQTKVTSLQAFPYRKGPLLPNNLQGPYEDGLKNTNNFLNALEQLQIIQATIMWRPNFSRIKPHGLLGPTTHPLLSSHDDHHKVLVRMDSKIRLIFEMPRINSK